MMRTMRACLARMGSTINYRKELIMTRFAHRVLGALLLLGVLAGCAATGTQESALQWLATEDEQQSISE